MFALQFGGKPRFYKDPMAEIYEHCQSLGLHLDRELAAATTQHRGEMHPTLYDVLVDMKVVSSVFNGHLGKVKVELHMFTRLMLSTCYRLLQFQALDGPPLVSNLDAVHYAGMMMFILTVFLRYDSRRIIECDLMSQCLEATIQRRLGEAYHELELWLLVIGGIWASAGGDDDGDWIIPRIVPMAQKMGLYTWGEVRGCIGNFPWINGIHDKPGQKLWKRLQKTL
jgi:hypothetical protein